MTAPAPIQARPSWLKNAGANGYVAKFAAAELASAIRNALNGMPVNSAAA